jgi:hypothetical protein
VFLDLPSSVTTETEILESQNIECLELTNQKSLNIKAKNRLRSTLSEGVATLVLVKIQLFSNINLETNISFKSCQYKKTAMNGWFCSGLIDQQQQ